MGDFLSLVLIYLALEIILLLGFGWIMRAVIYTIKAWRILALLILGVQAIFFALAGIALPAIYCLICLAVGYMVHLSFRRKELLETIAIG